MKNADIIQYSDSGHQSFLKMNTKSEESNI